MSSEWGPAQRQHLRDRIPLVVWGMRSSGVRSARAFRDRATGLIRPCDPAAAGARPGRDFIREASLAARLSHTEHRRLIDFAESTGYFIAMSTSQV